MALLIGFLSFCIYAVDGRAHLIGQSGDTDSNQLLPIALLAGDGFVFDRFFPTGQLPYAIRQANGHLLAQYPILPGIINTATYAVALHISPRRDLRADTAYLSLITGSVLTALSVAAIFLLLSGEGYAVGVSFGLSLVYAFGTSAFSVASRGIWQHGPALLFLSCALLLLRQPSNRLVALAGLAIGLAVESRVPVLMLALPLFIVPWQRGYKCLSWFIFAFAVPIALMRVYAWCYWGSPFVFAENMGNVTRSFVGHNPLEGLAGVLISPGRGLFIYSPFAVFAVIGALNAWRTREKFLVAVTIGVFLYVLTVAAWQSWWGGKSFGTRMLTEIFPGIILLAAQPIVEWWRGCWWRRTIVISALGWSVLVNYAGARHYPQLPFKSELEENRTTWLLDESELAATHRALYERIQMHIGLAR